MAQRATERNIPGPRSVHSVPPFVVSVVKNTAMKLPKIALVLLFATLNSCSAQSTRKVGGPCEGCKAIFEFGKRALHATDTLPGFNENEPKLKITGTVFHRDGKTPAKNTIVYIYHTSRRGLYERKGDETGWARRHGYIRGWIRTGADGRYTFYTFRPAHYPDKSEPEHIHVTVKEENRNEYYIDEYVFDDDPLLTSAKRSKTDNRGGSGIMKTKTGNGMLTIRRDIILGLNIPGYD